MADASAVALQNAVNRFAASLGFSKLVVDGVIGAKTLAATQRTLDYMSIETDDGLPAAIVAAAEAARQTTMDSVRLAVQAGQVASLINMAANTLGLPVVNSPVAPTPNVASNTPIGPSFTVTPSIMSAGPAASITDAWKRLELWQKIALLAMFGVGAVWAYKHISGGSETRTLRGVRRRGRSKKYLLVEA